MEAIRYGVPVEIVRWGRLGGLETALRLALIHRSAQKGPYSIS